MAAKSTETLIGRDPAGEQLYLQTLEHCEDGTTEEEAADFVEGLRTSSRQVQSGSSIVATLIRLGGLARTILVDGRPYAGTIGDLQRDEKVADDAKIETLVRTTEEGCRIAAQVRARSGLAALVTAHPEHRDGYMAALEACAQVPEGLTTNELQERLIEASIVQPGVEGAQQLHASYFTSKLERAGALVWDRRHWCATQEGKDALGA